MPEYHSPLDDKAADLDEQATHALEQGGSSRDTGEEYVRVTVFLAMVLFLIAMSQRFKIRNVRLGLIGLAVVFTGFALTFHPASPTCSRRLACLAVGLPARQRVGPQVDDLGHRRHQE